MRLTRFPLLPTALLVLAPLLPRLSQAQSAQAVQSLPLEQLQKFSTLPADLPWAKMTEALLPSGWVYRGRVGSTREVYWTSPASDAGNEAEAETEAASWLSVRPAATGGDAAPDVLFKTRAARYFEPLRRELKRQKIEPSPVTCRDCVAERYDAPGFTLTMYREMKGEYPFVAVLHQLPAGRPAPSTATTATGTATGPLLAPAPTAPDTSRQYPPASTYPSAGTIAPPPAPRP